MKPRVLVTRNIPAESLALLEPHFEVDYRAKSTPIARKCSIFSRLILSGMTSSSR